MPSELPATTFEQWFVLQTVVDEGSFTRAAERLNRSQSAVSYALNALQERLGMELLQIVGRKAELTEAGRLMLAQAQPLLASFRQLEFRAHGLKAGVRANLALIVDTVFPKSVLFAALRAFQQAYPQVQVHVTEVLRTESEQLLAQQEADLYIVALKQEAARMGNFLMNMDFVAVAHPDHPLHGLEGPLTAAQLEQYPLVAMADRAQQRTEMRHKRALWSFTTIEAAIEAVCHGVGYGWLPLARIESLLARGELKRLPMAAQQVRQTPLYLIFGSETLCYDQTVTALADVIRQLVSRPGGRIL
ncbi:LysR family transcriptional regulator [Uliginosibacterium gangwonense]|uniref:LysR family transcriptional regulator n=1 Tax=Uliginosibacterium gangwonense TaxID=392736 RepID=UPI00037FC26A|nr:LysR family transcriptional regulator [Uliginosibacterium gangwonense]